MRTLQSVVASSFLAFLLSPNQASAGVAVVIDRTVLKLVSGQSGTCPSQYVKFVTREGRITAICDAPPPSPAPQTAAAEERSPTAVTLLPPAAPPTWRIAQDANIRETLGGWMPADWRLAWDTEAMPVANAPFEFRGELMAAIADLFDRRGVWGDAPLRACVYKAEKIMQVRDRGECGAP